MSTEINQTKASAVACIQNQLPDTVSVQAPLFAAFVAKRKFEPGIQYLSSIITETSSTYSASHHFAAVKIPINKNLRQKQIWVGTPDPKASAEMDVSLADLVHRNYFPL